MPRTPFVWFVLLCANLVLAQETAPAPAPDALAAARQKLTAALQKTARLTDTGFQASWAPDHQPDRKDRKKMAGVIAFETAFGASMSGSFQGSWHADRQHFVSDGDCHDELIVAGRRTIAKDGTRPWQLRAGRFADGNAAGFLPDVPLLLQLMAGWDLAVVQRAASSLDDRPVEVISVTLNRDQVGEAVWTGLLPESVVTPLNMGAMRMRLGAVGAERTAATVPEATVDLAITIDPSTSLVHQIQFRGWAKENAGGGAGGVFVVRAGGGVQVGGGDEDDEEEVEADETKQAAAKAAAPMTYENGLPVRPRKKTSVMNYTVRVTEHGTRQAPELSAEQNRLLGR